MQVEMTSECVDGHGRDLADLNTGTGLNPPRLHVEGSQCPRCRQGRLEYDGMLILRCDYCGNQDEVGCFT